MRRNYRCLWLLPLILAGCHGGGLGVDRSTIDRALDERMGRQVGMPTTPATIVLPQGLSLEEPLTEDAAIAIALWNNALFQELLVDLHITKADLVQAGLLPNPEVFYSVPVQDKAFKYLFEFPAESFWLRPIGVKTAEPENARLSQAALDLIRDVRQAYADTIVARARRRIAQENVKLRKHIYDLVNARLNDGDAGLQDAASAKIDLLQATQDATRIRYDAPVAEERLRNLLGIGLYRGSLTLDPPDPIPNLEFDIEALTRQVLETRPDVATAASVEAHQEVNRAFELYRRARREWDLLQQKVRPEIDAAMERAEKAYQEGNASYLILLESSRQSIDALAREADLQADLRRAWAELERAVGRRLPPRSEIAPAALPTQAPKAPGDRERMSAPPARKRDQFAAQSDLHVIPVAATAPTKQPAPRTTAPPRQPSPSGGFAVDRE